MGVVHGLQHQQKGGQYGAELLSAAAEPCLSTCAAHSHLSWHAVAAAAAQGCKLWLCSPWTAGGLSSVRPLAQPR